MILALLIFFIPYVVLICMVYGKLQRQTLSKVIIAGVVAMVIGFITPILSELIFDYVVFAPRPAGIKCGTGMGAVMILSYMANLVCIPSLTAVFSLYAYFQE